MDALVTGGAGFIGSHLVDALLARGDRVRVLDDLSTGRRENLAADAELVEGSVADEAVVARAVDGIEVVFHLGALGAVARSVADPRASNAANVDGTLNVLTLGRDAGVRRVVFASSSSVYGGAEVVPTPESTPLRPRSPYANTKLAGEWYVRLFAELYPIETVALRYFNVFGPRQRPDSTYAAVIPLFAAALLAGERPTVHGDGTQSRDFTFVSDVVAANLAAAAADPARASGQAFNVAPGAGTSLLELLDGLAAQIGVTPDPVFVEPRPGDVKISCADASAAHDVLGWAPTVSVADGLARYVDWLRATS
jgi:UDP-glucose 4-epimerase